MGKLVQDRKIVAQPTKVDIRLSTPSENAQELISPSLRRSDTEAVMGQRFVLRDERVGTERALRGESVIMSFQWSSNQLKISMWSLTQAIVHNPYCTTECIEQSQ